MKGLLKVASGDVVFTTIQKFQTDEGNVYETLSERENFIVIADEAHRTQYGFKAKTIDDKDEDGNVIGKKILYGFAKYMRDALPNATIDWSIKESVRAKLQVIVKRILRQIGYPPDMQKLATETVLKQAELIAVALTG